LFGKLHAEEDVGKSTTQLFFGGIWVSSTKARECELPQTLVELVR
jgi:hypothetical protein